MILLGLGIDDLTQLGKTHGKNGGFDQPNMGNPRESSQTSAAALRGTTGNPW